MLENQLFLPAFLAALLAAQLALSALLTVRLARSSAYDLIQKRLQIALLWLLPIFGVLLVWLFLAPAERPRADIEQENEDDDVEESAFAHHRSSASVSDDAPDAT